MTNYLETKANFKSVTKSDQTNILYLKTVSNTDLDQNLKNLITKEREVLTEILLHIAEVDRRKLYLSLAYSNLFEYLTKHIGYSNGSAQRRIDAARLSNTVPDIVTNLENGSLNLSQVSLLQKAIRQVQVENKTKVAAQITSQILSDIKNKSMTESEILISQTLNLPIKESPSIKHQQNESVRFEVTLSKQQWQKIIRMRELLSNSLPHGSWDQVLEYLAEKVILQKDKSLEKGRIQEGKKGNAKAEENGRDREKQMTENKTAPKNTGNLNLQAMTRTPITMQIQRQIFNRDKCCQFEDSLTGKKCTSTWQLNLDHIQPVWAGGTNATENLRVICANHNREIYRQHAGLRRIQ